jgi:hypothetical protein
VALLLLRLWLLRLWPAMRLDPRLHGVPGSTTFSRNVSEE